MGGEMGCHRQPCCIKNIFSSSGRYTCVLHPYLIHVYCTHTSREHISAPSVQISPKRRLWEDVVMKQCKAACRVELMETPLDARALNPHEARALNPHEARALNPA